MNKLANKAVQKPDTSKPRTSLATSKTIKALMTPKKEPKVSTVSGRVSTTSKGLTKLFAMPSSSAATHKEARSANLIPRNTWLATQSDAAVMAHCTIKAVRFSNMMQLS